VAEFISAILYHFNREGRDSFTPRKFPPLIHRRGLGGVMSNHFCSSHNPLYPPYLKGDGEGSPDLSGWSNLQHKIVKDPRFYRVFTPRISVVRPFRVVRHEAKASHYISKHQESRGNSIFPGREGTPMYRDSSE